MDTVAELSDDELIVRYLASSDDVHFRTLVDRHNGRLFARFVAELRNRADARDLVQQLWLRVYRNLGSYKSEGKFPEYLSTISSNLITDYWRSKGRRSEIFAESRVWEDSETPVEQRGYEFGSDPSNTEHSATEHLFNQELVSYLVTVLVPRLPTDQRMAWLLRHESEYWEPAQRLEWRHLAELNGIQEDEAWASFESARNKMMTSWHQRSDSGGDDRGRSTISEPEEILIFTVWSQAQRPRKEDNFTWDYFADLLNVPVNTMKTRYRAAQKTLSEGLKARMSA